MPEIMAVPVPLWNFTPFGSLPFPLTFGVGVPVVVTVSQDGCLHAENLQLPARPGYAYGPHSCRAFAPGSTALVGQQLRLS